MLQSHTSDLTHGPVTRQLIRFALPLLVGSLVQLMYSTVDMMFVGQYLGGGAAAAVGASSMIVNCIVGFFSGLSVGVGVTAGRAMGAGDTDRLRGIIHTAAALTLLLSAMFTAGGITLAPAFLSAMDVPPEIMPDAVLYIRIYLLSLLAIVSYNIGAGIIKALGNSSSPMLYQLLGGAANIGGNWLFICVLHLGVQGAAMTTLLSQTLAAMLTAGHLFRLPEEYCLHIRRIRLESHLAGEILRIGFPAAVQAIILSASNAVVQTNINRLGVESIAAFTAYYKAENLIYFPIMAVGQACSAFVSQNIGAGDLLRTRQGTRSSLLIGIPVTVAVSALSLLFAPQLFGAFYKEAEVIALSCRIARVSFSLYFLYVFLEVYAASIRAAGKALVTMGITILNMCVIRLGVLKLLMLHTEDAAGIAAVYPITWACSALCMFAYYRSGRWMPETLREDRRHIL